MPNYWVVNHFKQNKTFENQKNQMHQLKLSIGAICVGFIVGLLR